jgi:VanZ family protein
MKFPVKSYLPGIAWFFFLLILLCLPGTDLPEADSWMKFIYFDKIIHACLFGTLAFLFMLPISSSTADTREKWIYVILITISTSVWGLSTEFIQKFLVSGRSFEFSDWVADSVGAIIALIINRKFYLRT